MTVPIQHRLPLEVLELFIDALGRDLNTTTATSPDRDSTLRASRTSLTACCLVSRSFRARAQHHLFSSLDFVGSARHTSWDLLSRFDSFRRLVEPDLDNPSLGPAMEGVGMAAPSLPRFDSQGCALPRVGPRPIRTHLFHHVRTLRIAPAESIFRAQALLANEDLVAIMRYVERFSPSLSHFSLSFSGLTVPMNLLSVSPPFRLAFDMLVQKDGLSVLELENVDGVDEEVLMNSVVRQLKLRNVRTARAYESSRLGTVGPGVEAISTGDQLWNLRPGQLDSLSVESSFYFPDLSKGRSPAAYSPAELEDQKKFEDGLSNVKHMIYTSQGLFSAEIPLIRNALLNVDSLHTLELSLDQLSCAFSSVIQDPCDTSSGLAQVLSHPDVYLPELRELKINLTQAISLQDWQPLATLTSMLDGLRSGSPSSEDHESKTRSSTPKLHRLTLGLSIYSAPPWTKREHFFPEQKAWHQLDTILATTSATAGKAVLSQIDSIHLDLAYRTVEARPWAFEESVFVDRCLGLMGEAFPRLTASDHGKRVTTSVSVSIGGGVAL